MGTLDIYAGQMHDVDAEVATLERQSADVEGETLGSIGGRLAGLAAKRKALGAKLDAARATAKTDAEAESERAYQARVKALTAKGIALQAQWQQWTVDQENAIGQLGTLARRYHELMASIAAHGRECEALHTDNRVDPRLTPALVRMRGNGRDLWRQKWDKPTRDEQGA